MIKRVRIKAVEGAQAPSIAVIYSSDILTLQKEGSGILVGSNKAFLLCLSFKTSTGKDVTYSYELFDEEEGSLWQEFKKLFAKHTSGTFIDVFQACAKEFVDNNAGRRVQMSFHFAQQDETRLIPMVKPRFQFIP